jgi:transcriptional regulator with XRE-family HTH domain
MYFADRFRNFREAKNLSQGDIETRTGLLRCYISRVENGHTVPSLETIEKLARALEIPLYQLFYDGVDAPGPQPPPRHDRNGDWASRGAGLRLFLKIQRAVSKMDDKDRQLILRLAKEVGKRK